MKDQIVAATSSDDDNTDVYAVGTVVAATVAAVLALWSIGM